MRSHSPLALVPLLAALAPDSVSGWVTSSQSIYGAQIHEIQAQMRGERVNKPSIEQLGWLWYWPEDTTSTRGLGGGITWAFSPELCKDLGPRFREDIFGGLLLGCEDYRAAMARAFDKWSANSRFIKFIDVSAECEAIGKLHGPPHHPPQSETSSTHGACPLAEIWVTSLGTYPYNGRRRRLDNHIHVPDMVIAELTGGMAVATAEPHANYVSDFRYTNGQSPKNSDGSPRSVVETNAGTFSFNAKNACWYMDTQFCAPFHDLKRHLGSAKAARTFVYGWTLGLCGLGLFFYSIVFCTVCLRVTVEAEDEDDEDGDGHISCKERLYGGLRALSHWSPIVLVIFILLLIVPGLITVKLFEPCFACYDFEAAALHEIGHFLGLGHPDNIPDNLAVQIPGNNSYNAIISTAVMSGTRPADVAAFCMDPWATVHAGVPEGAIIDHEKLGAKYPTRDAQMEAQTQHNPKACLMEDDLEALAVLYPDCDPATAHYTPICHVTKLNIGIVRTAVYILLPAIFALLGVVCFNSVVHKFERREKERHIAAHDALHKSVENSKAIAKAQQQKGRKQTAPKAAYQSSATEGGDPYVRT